jgi:protease PrsW
MQLYLLSYLITIVFWLWIIMKYDKFEREPLKSVIKVFLVGGLISTIPAAIFNQLFALLINYRFNGDFYNSQGVLKTMQFFAFVGINEECCKALATVILIRKMKDFNEPADALVYSMTVAFGFSVFENITYTIDQGLASFYIRQFNAVPMHIGMAAIWGIGIAKAKFLNDGDYLKTMLPYVMIAALFHFIYNFIPRLITHPLYSLLFYSLLAFLLIRFAIRKEKHYSEDGPFSNRLYCRHCNTPNLLFARGCVKCGEKFHLEFYDFCRSCNAKIDKHAEICPKCSAEFVKTISVDGIGHKTSETQESP